MSYNNLLFAGLILLFNLTVSCQNMDSKSNSHKKANQLINESSPYLLQHAYNPVDWNAWNDEVLAKAKKENKLLIISIGYAACHWCHVMEHESFEDSAVAALMNEHFISIKIDREERPDIDQIYMSAAQLLTGSGGWPLNAIALPDGRPIYAGTYFPKDKWMSVLNQVNNYYQQNPEKTLEQAQKITEGINQSEIVDLKPFQSQFDTTILTNTVNNWMNTIDFIWGGQNRAPKFPLPVGYDFLLEYYGITKNPQVYQALTTTLDKMALGGIFDQIGGGFARYSVDKYWLAPHFEKMLYDNGQLVSLYSKAYKLTQKPLYKETVYKTLEFIERELTDETNGFYSSLDADSEDIEGKFYVWTEEEVKSVAKEDFELIKVYYNIKPDGNWEHKNILFRQFEDREIVEKFGLSINDLQKKVNQFNEELLKIRATRIRPALDDKILTSWNALMLKGYVDAYTAFGEEKFLNKALKNIEFLEKNVIKEDFRVDRNFKNNNSTINGFLADYATLIEAYILLYEATFEEKHLNQAKNLTDYTIKHFYDDKSKMFFYTSNIDAPLISRKMETQDNVIPASNSIMAINLFKLGELFYNKDYTEKSQQMLSNVTNEIENYGAYYSNWAKLLWLNTQAPIEIAIVGKDAEKLRNELSKEFIPNVIFMGGKNEGTLPLLQYKLQVGETMIYVCQNKQCKFPTDSVEKAIQLITEIRK